MDIAKAAAVETKSRMCSELSRAAMRLVATALLMIPFLTQAASLEWDRNDDTNVVGYRVYYGQNSRSYHSVIDANNQIIVSLPSLQPGRTYYFAVTAYNRDGLESDFSEEASYYEPPVNGAPVAVPDDYQTTRNTPLNVSGNDGVLDNDYDAEDDQIVALLVSTTTHGLLDFDYDGLFTYTPAPGFIGADAFTYFCTDGHSNSQLATVIITVLPPPNNPPVAQADEYQTIEGTPLNVTGGSGILNNDVDVDEDPLAALLVSTTAHGVLSLASSGSFSYSPEPGFAGTDAFTYRCTDGRATSAVVVVTITVTGIVTPPPPNNTPVAQNDIYSTIQDTPLSVIGSAGVLTNDFDADGDTLTALLVSGASHGTLVFAGNGAFIYSPAIGFFGTDVFTYSCTDGNATSEVATVTITIVEGVPPPPINNPPVAQADSYQTIQNVPLNVTGTAGILNNDLDAEGDTLAALLVATTPHGVLSLADSGSFSYSPATGFVGTDTFAYRCTDGNGTSEVVTVTITISPDPSLPNHAPVAQADIYQTTESVTLNVTAATGVLNNDLDLDGDPLTARLVSSTAHGLLILASSGAVTYVPVAGFTGTDAFTYRCTDGKATSAVVAVTITVTSGVAPPPPNNLPLAQADTYQVIQNASLNVTGSNGILNNDSDADGDPLAVLLVSTTAHGALNINSSGLFTYLPVQNFVGADSFMYCNTDGKATSAVVTVTIYVLEASDSSGCPECLAQLVPILAARGGSLSTLLNHVRVPENSTCLESELIQFYAVAKALGRLNDSQLNAAINSVAACLNANLEMELGKKEAGINTLLPSKWSTRAGSHALTISNQLQQAAGMTTASRAKRFLTVAAALRRTDQYIASGRIAPATLSNQVFWCRFSVSGHTVQKKLKFNNDQSLTVEDMQGNTIERGGYDYERTAFDSANLQILLDNDPVVRTLAVRFGPKRGRISGDMRGWLTVVQQN